MTASTRVPPDGRVTKDLPTADVIDLNARRPKKAAPEPVRAMPTSTPELALILALLDALGKRKRKAWRGFTVPEIMAFVLGEAEAKNPGDPSLGRAIFVVGELTAMERRRAKQ